MLMIAQTNQISPEAFKAAILGLDPGAIISVAKEIETHIQEEVSPSDQQWQIKVEAAASVIRNCLTDAKHRSAIRTLLGGGSTCGHSGDEDLRNPRAIFAALSGKLRKHPVLSDLDAFSMLAVRERKYFPNGVYKGVEYTPTKFGSDVYAAIKEDLAIFA